MARFFNRIRQRLAAENKATAYARYAFGEIVLVVIGILIALQVNNWNERRVQRASELHYLANIKNDLTLNIAEIERYIAKRNSQTASARNILEYYEGKPLTDLDAFVRDAVNVYTWQKFFQIDNTFQELTYSGNLSILSNDSIKEGLLTLETLYKKLKYEEEHFRYDSEVMLYEPSYGTIDINAMVKNFIYQSTGGRQGVHVQIARADVDRLLNNRKHKNGFAMAMYEFQVMNAQLERMRVLCASIITAIDAEHAR